MMSEEIGEIVSDQSVGNLAAAEFLLRLVLYAVIHGKLTLILRGSSFLWLHSLDATETERKPFHHHFIITIARHIAYPGTTCPHT